MLTPIVRRGYGLCAYRFSGLDWTKVWQTCSVLGRDKISKFLRSFPNNISLVLQYCDANFYSIKTVEILEMTMSLKSITWFLN